MKLCIAEKPSVAKDLAQVLGAKTRRDGYFEGNGYAVTWTFGHLCTLKEPNDYTEKWRAWNVHSLPMIPSKFGIKVMDNSGVKKQFRTIETLVNKATEIINCGDAGQEGELIQRWVLSKAKNTKPLKRLWISSLTEEAIKDGFKNLRDGKEFNRLYAAGSCRAIGDWLLGLNATRLYTIMFGTNRQVLSIGRVQTPTLAMIVERQEAIDLFTPENYWEIDTLYRNTVFSYEKGRFSKKEKAEQVLEAISSKELVISSFKQKEGKETPPQLYDLTSLQVACNRKYGFSAEDTLKMTQSLYEKKLVTYPRVDTRYLPNDQYPKIKGILAKLPFAKLTEPLLGKKIRKSSKVFNDKKVTDHHAIIPTGVNPSGVNLDERKVYETITKTFIAAFYPDCIVSNTTVKAKIEKHPFKATGKQILDPGWRVVFGGTESTEEDVMPVFEEGENGDHQPQLLTKKTKPPAYYTEASLLRAMETAGKAVENDELRELMKENGIGRPSTRANIIETLFKRGYIKKEKKRIIATDTGKKLINLIHFDILKSPALTGQWERKLREIEKGDLSVNEFKTELNKMVTRLVHEVKHGIRPKQVRLSELSCPKCQGQMLAGRKAYGCSGYKTGCDFVIPFVVDNKKVDSNRLKEIIDNFDAKAVKTA